MGKSKQPLTSVDRAKARYTHINTFHFLGNADDDTWSSTSTKDEFSSIDPDTKKDEFRINDP